MTSPDESASQSPGQQAEERVRHLLRAARHTDPMPPDVAARLEATVAGLVAEREDSMQAPVIDLAARRRHRATTWLVAAAAIVALGVGLPTIVNTVSGVGGPDSSSSSADSKSASVSPEIGGSADFGSADSDSQLKRQQPSAPAPTTLSESAEQGALTTARPLRPQLRAVLQLSTLLTRDAHSSDCVLPDRAGEVYPVTLDGSPALVLAQPPAHGKRLVELYLCGQTDPVASKHLSVVE